MSKGRSFLDILDSKDSKDEYKSESKSESKSGSDKAPIELMTQFLVLISNSEMKEALVACNELLTFEPSNKLLLEYKKSLTEYIKQGLDDKPPPSPEPSEDEVEEDEDEDEEDEEEESDEEVK